MHLNDYQIAAKGFAKYPEGQALTYTALGMGSEAGEYQGKIKKVIRDNNGVVSEERHTALKDELGDVLWYVSECARALGCALEDVAATNLVKLQGRSERGTIQGSGDVR